MSYIEKVRVGGGGQGYVNLVLSKFDNKYYILKVNRKRQNDLRAIAEFQVM